MDLVSMKRHRLIAQMHTQDTLQFAPRTKDIYLQYESPTNLFKLYGVSKAAHLHETCC